MAVAVAVAVGGGGGGGGGRWRWLCWAVLGRCLYFILTLPAFASSNCSVLYIESAMIQQIRPMIA